MTFRYLWLSLKRTVVAQIAQLIPWHVRRILYLLAVYRTVSGVERFGLSELDELNKVFHLASTGTEALVLSGAVTKWIHWFDGAVVTTTAVLNNVPCWLTYGYSDEQRKDTERVLQYVGQRT